MIAYMRFDTTRLNNAFRLFVVFMARANYGNAYFGVYCNDILVANVFAPEGQEVRLAIPIVPFSTRAGVTILRLGYSGDPGYSIARVARISDTGDTSVVTARWTWKALAIGADLDGGFTSNWVLNGCTRKNTAGVSSEPLYGELQLDITINAGVATVTLSYQGIVAASGSAAIVGAPFAVTLSAQNGSGISGSLTLSNTVAAVAAGAVYVKWPASMNVLRGTANPPTVAVANILNDGRDAGIWTEPADLPANTYYYELQSVSDDGVAGGSTAAFTAVVHAPPLPVSNLVYVSGSAGAGITLGFTSSGTVGATYNAYVGTPTLQMNLNDVKATAIAGSSTIVIPAGALGGGAGTYGFLVRDAVFGAALEEKNFLDADHYCTWMDRETSSIRAPINRRSRLALSFSLVSKSLCASSMLRRMKRELRDADPDFRAQSWREPQPGVAGAAGGTGQTWWRSSGRIKGVTLVYTFPSDQIVFLAAAALTALGAQGPLSAEVGPFNPSTAANQPAPDNYAFSVSRG